MRVEARVDSIRHGLVRFLRLSSNGSLRSRDDVPLGSCRGIAVVERSRDVHAGGETLKSFNGRIQDPRGRPDGRYLPLGRDTLDVRLEVGQKGGGFVPGKR